MKYFISDASILIARSLKNHELCFVSCYDASLHTFVFPIPYNNRMPLREGAGSKTIKQKQWQLYYLGYYGGKIDGIWGSQSKAAAVRFQKDFNLDADGIFGTLTIAKSLEIIKPFKKRSQMEK